MSCHFIQGIFLPHAHCTRDKLEIHDPDQYKDVSKEVTKDQ